uniref:P2X purinoreceptor 7 intracellular domain-containing protein n=1 Tax=Salarias fasciatus TaxID=181472 RepID=A0A672GRD5_SALFA
MLQSILGSDVTKLFHLSAVFSGVICSQQPFQFEPTRNQIQSEDENESNNGDDNENDSYQEEERVGHSRWCLCGCCLPMATERESVCCKENGCSLYFIIDLPCITAHPNFQAVCINPDVLWAALVSLHDRFSTGLPNRSQITNRSYRYAAYRQFTWWMHGWLGKRVRRVIPSCSVNHIRQIYPEENRLYTGFQAPQVLL